LEKPLLRLTRHCWAWIVAALLQACAFAPGGPTPPGDAAPAAAAPAQALPPAAASRAPAAPSADASPQAPFDGDSRQIEDPLRGVTTIDLTVPPDNLWERIRHGFAMPDLKGELVRKRTSEYAANTEYLQRILDRSRLYLYHIVEELEKRGLPMEIALLPMVESAFNPMAYSRSRASGLWQFMPRTGKHYDLEQNWWLDERRDVLESTKAALDYLTFLYEMHGDWHLALASYNWGEGSVKRAVARNRAAHKPTDYQSLKMPRETRNYIPKLQALKNIIADPKPYGIDLDPIPNEPYFAVVDKTPDIDVQVAAKLAEMPVEDFVALNPSFSRPLIRAAGVARIILPADKVDLFRENLAQSDAKSLVSWQIYHPRPGEKLGTIAKKYHLGIADLKRVNGISPGSWNVPRVMVVPLNDGASSIVVTPPIMYAPPTRQAAGGGVHVVRRGDTLSSIAARFRVSVAQLKRLNPASDSLQIGQRIRVR
jgi:membrane-bound lytic murein transglycosylase D